MRKTLCLATAFLLCASIACLLVGPPSVKAQIPNLAQTAWTSASVSSVTSVSANPGFLTGYDVGNQNATWCYLEFFDMATANVVLGTTQAYMHISIPPNGGANMSFPPTAFRSGISIAATTTPNGATPCSTGLTVTLLHY